MTHPTPIRVDSTHGKRTYRSDDDGKSFTLLAIIPAPVDRDLRDPSFYVIDGKLAIKAITRLPVNSTRDSDVDSISVNTISSDDGTTWSPLAAIGPDTWSFWRIRDDAAGTHYSAAYEDGDKSVKLFTSVDGNQWTAGAVIYDVAVDTPLETELVFQGDDDLLALVRVDGTDDEILGNKGRLRTIVCQAHRPFATFTCPYALDGVRLDGPVAFQWKNRLFVIARKHFIEAEDRKRTALYELVPGEAGQLGWVEHGEMPSAGDTAYAGAAFIGDGNHVLATWYSTNIKQDGPWARAIFGPTDIWQATIDLTAL